MNRIADAALVKIVWIFLVGSVTGPACAQSWYLVHENVKGKYYIDKDAFPIFEQAGTAITLPTRSVEMNVERTYEITIYCAKNEFSLKGEAVVRVPANSPAASIQQIVCNGQTAQSIGNGLARRESLERSTASASPVRSSSERTARASSMAVDQADDEDDETERQAETQRQLQMLQQLQSMQRGGGYSAPAQPSASSARAPTQSSNVASANRDKSHLRVDNCLKFEVKSTPSSYGDATVTNACNFTIQYSFCYQGGTGKLFDCGGSPRDRGSDSLGPGSKHDLPEYKRDRNTGLTAVACRGAVGDVLPLISNSGRPPGCY